MSQEYEKAAEIRDQEQKKRSELNAAKEQWKNETSSKTETVTAEEIAQIVSSWTGVPLTKMEETDTDRLLHMEDILHQRVVGQDDAVIAVSKAIRRARSGLKNPNGLLVPSFSWGPPASARPNWPAPWPKPSLTMRTPSSASI